MNLGGKQCHRSSFVSLIGLHPVTAGRALMQAIGCREGCRGRHLMNDLRADLAKASPTNAAPVDQGASATIRRAAGGRRRWASTADEGNNQRVVLAKRRVGVCQRAQGTCKPAVKLIGPCERSVGVARQKTCRYQGQIMELFQLPTCQKSRTGFINSTACRRSNPRGIRSSAPCFVEPSTHVQMVKGPAQNQQ